MVSSAGLSADPYNLIITGVGGQGNVLASRMVGNMLSRLGLFVTIGETFGASQRGGSVMSHLRISTHSCLSPQIPQGRAHGVVALEPIEAVRVLAAYGNPDVSVICNTRPIHPVAVISGEASYPSLEDLEAWIHSLSRVAWFIDATEGAVGLGNPVLGNVICVGALAAAGLLPLERGLFEAVAAETFPPEKRGINHAAFDLGARMVREGGSS